MTKKLILILTLILSLSVSMPSAAKSAVGPDTISARRAFVEMPATVLDLLPKSTRLDMLDFFDVDSIYNAVNSLEGISSLEAVTPDYLKVRLTPVSSMQFKVLKNKKGNDIVMTIYTVGGGREAKDSDIRFFDTQLQELNRDKFMKLPELKDFFNIPKESKTTMKEINDLIPFATMEFNASPGSDIVTGKLTVGQFLSQEDYDYIKSLERPQVTLRWDGKTLRPAN